MVKGRLLFRIKIADCPNFSAAGEKFNVEMCPEAVLDILVRVEIDYDAFGLFLVVVSDLDLKSVSELCDQLAEIFANSKIKVHIYRV